MSSLPLWRLREACRSLGFDDDKDDDNDDSSSTRSMDDDSNLTVVVEVVVAVPAAVANVRVELGSAFLVLLAGGKDV